MAMNYHTPKSKYELAAKGNVVALQRLLADNELIVLNSDSAGQSMLHHAVKNGHVDAVRLLLAHNAPLNGFNDDKHTPLMLAAKSGNAEMCALLMDAGANSTYVDPAYGRAAIHLAVEGGFADACRALVEHGADIHLLTTGGIATTPLHLAARKGDAGLVKTLLELGAAPNMLSDSGVDALYDAASADRLEVCKLLIQRGAHPTRMTDGYVQNTNCLHAASSRGAMNVCRFLVSTGMSPSFAPENAPASYLTPFQYAVMCGREVAVRYFIDECGEDLDQLSLDGRSLVMLAKDCDEVVALLHAEKTARVVAASVEVGEDASAPSTTRAVTLSPI